MFGVPNGCQTPSLLRSITNACCALRTHLNKNILQNPKRHRRNIKCAKLGLIKAANICSRGFCVPPFVTEFYA